MTNNPYFRPSENLSGSTLQAILLRFHRLFPDLRMGTGDDGDYRVQNSSVSISLWVVAL
jgi:hypothetical protein